MRPQLLQLALAVVTTTLVFAGLRPFDFAPPNRVHWSDGGGLSFEQPAIAFTREVLPWPSAADRASVSVELWIEEVPRAPNWGHRTILSLNDAGSRSLVVGSYGGLVFLDRRLRRERDGGARYAFFSDVEFERGRTVLITAVFARDGNSLFLDGRYATPDVTVSRVGEPVRFDGRLVLGSESSGTRAWIGTLRGLALYARALRRAEIAEHAERWTRSGVASLRGEPDLLALYPLNEGTGRLAHSLASGAPPLVVPERFVPFPSALLSGDAGDLDRLDTTLNTVGFVPLGLVLGLLAGAAAPGRRTLGLVIGLAAGTSLSLGIEAAQLYLPTRNSTLLDWGCNTAGTVLGLGFALLAGRVRRHRPS